MLYVKSVELTIQDEISDISVVHSLQLVSSVYFLLFKIIQSFHFLYTIFQITLSQPINDANQGTDHQDTDNNVECGPCKSLQDVFEMAKIVSDGISYSEPLDEWINSDVLENFSKKIAEKSIELQAAYKTLNTVLTGFASFIEVNREGLVKLVLFVSDGINSDGDIVEYVQIKMDYYDNHPNETFSDIYKYCKLIHEAQNAIKEFNTKINTAVTAFKSNIAPEMNSIIQQTIDLTTKYNKNDKITVDELIKAKNDIQTLIKLIQSQLNSENMKTIVSNFQNTSEDAAAECESNLKSIFTEMKDKEE